MQTPWTNKKIMAEIILRQTKNTMSFQISPRGMETFGEIEMKEAVMGRGSDSQEDHPKGTNEEGKLFSEEQQLAPIEEIPVFFQMPEINEDQIRFEHIATQVDELIEMEKGQISSPAKHESNTIDEREAEVSYVQEEEAELIELEQDPIYDTAENGTNTIEEREAEVSYEQEEEAELIELEQDPIYDTAENGTNTIEEREVEVSYELEEEVELIELEQDPISDTTENESNTIEVREKEVSYEQEEETEPIELEQDSISDTAQNETSTIEQREAEGSYEQIDPVAEDYVNNRKNQDPGSILNIRVPVILGNYTFETGVEDEEIFPDSVKELKEISHKVIMTNCKFVPTEWSPALEDGSCHGIKGILMIEGNIQQEIKCIFEKMQATSDGQMNSSNRRKNNLGRYSYTPQTYPTVGPGAGTPRQTIPDHNTELLNHYKSKVIPFKQIVDIKYFLHPPLFSSIKEKSFVFQNVYDPYKGEMISTQFNNTFFYPENIYGKLINAKIHQSSNGSKLHLKAKKFPFIKLKQWIVLELSIQLLQEQSVQVQLPTNEYNQLPYY